MIRHVQRFSHTLHAPITRNLSNVISLYGIFPISLVFGIDDKWQVAITAIKQIVWFLSSEVRMIYDIVSKIP